jgi:hypothetical protein
MSNLSLPPSPTIFAFAGIKLDESTSQDERCRMTNGRCEHYRSPFRVEEVVVNWQAVNLTYGPFKDHRRRN